MIGLAPAKASACARPPGTALVAAQRRRLLSRLTLFWVALVAGTVVLVRRWQQDAPARQPAPITRVSAQELLDQRLALGEIDADEYRLRRDALQREAGPTIP